MLIVEHSMLFVTTPRGRVFDKQGRAMIDIHIGMITRGVSSIEYNYGGRQSVPRKRIDS